MLGSVTFNMVVAAVRRDPAVAALAAIICVAFGVMAILFASLYAVLDRFSDAANFSVTGDSRTMTFAEALYFSFITLSTIGYGDITPVTGVARVVVVGEIIFGVVLMLFAFAEIAAYDPHAPDRGTPGE